jgi:ferrous iron transport protein B
LIPDGDASAVASKTRLFALVGNPNSGKTTLFNQLTGLRHRVGNYAGVTVERREGTLVGSDATRVLDLPGCYSLVPRSPDECIARDALLGWMGGERKPDGVIVVIDASNLERNLFLATQVLDLGLPTVVVCNMLDVVGSRGDSIDLDVLSQKLGAPVVGTVARRGEGIDALREAIARLGDRANEARSPRLEALSDPTNELIQVVEKLVEKYGLAGAGGSRTAAMLLLSPSALENAETGRSRLPSAFRESLERVLENVQQAGNSASLEVVQARYAWIGDVADAVVRRTRSARQASLSDRIDRIATHKVWGLVTFSGLMLVIFLAIFSWSGPMMDGIDWLIGSAGVAVASALGPGMMTDLVVDGAIAGVGNVVVFFPQICILFLFISLLEDSGYMARAAFVMDRVMSGVGLHGKSFIPLLSSFACAVPGILAARTIENPRDRLTTILVAPLMSCSARLPVYIIIISSLFGGSVWVEAGIMFSMYALGMLAALTMALVFKRTILRGPTPSFIMELPEYRMPRVSGLLRHTWDRSKSFLTQAGSIIFAMSIVLWSLAYFPRAPESQTGEVGVQLRQSYLGKIGHAMEPVIAPLGFDWKIGIGLTASFAAREVFVATMGIVYGVEGEADERSGPLRERIAAERTPDGRRVYTPLVGISVMVFYVLACQCVSTLAVVRRETNSWRWPAFLFGYQTCLAYLGSLLVFQVGSALGFGS